MDRDANTNTTSEAAMQSPGADFEPGQEMPFEMVWLPKYTSLLVMFTGNFDQILYVNPDTGASTYAIFNMHDYKGTVGALEFTVDDRLEVMDTTANLAVDNVKNIIYFQCSDVDVDSGDVTTALCEHPMAPDVTPQPNAESWDYININVEPMTCTLFRVRVFILVDLSDFSNLVLNQLFFFQISDGYAGAEYVQILNKHK